MAQIKGSMDEFRDRESDWRILFYIIGMFGLMGKEGKLVKERGKYK